MCFVNGEFEKLPDGIRVYRGPETSIIRGTWTLLLTIREPGIEYRDSERTNLKRNVQTLLTAIRAEKVTATITEKRKRLWMRRLNLILTDRSLHFNIEQPTRDHRGLIDAGGWLLNKVFGTATQQQLNYVKNQLASASRQRVAVVHNTQRLITMVNQTRMEASATREQLDRLGVAHNQFVQDEMGRWTSLQTLMKYGLIEQWVESLCDIDEGLNRELSAINDLHITIRQGRVTEAICPITLINNINQLAHTHGLVPLPTEWYYQNLDITPLLVLDGSVTYRIEVPYITNAVYERYTIRSYGVPINESGITAKVVVRPDIAVHTTEGYWFVPQ